MCAACITTELGQGHFLQEALEQESLHRSANSEENLGRSTSDANLPTVLGQSTSFTSGGSDPHLHRMGTQRSASYMNKLESLASSAVRSADKVGAKLIIVYTQSGLPSQHLRDLPGAPVPMYELRQGLLASIPLADPFRSTQQVYTPGEQVNHVDFVLSVLFMARLGASNLCA